MSRRARIGAAAALAIALVATAAPARAQTNAGTAVGQFLLIEPGARLAAMGNAGVSVAGGIDGVYYNAAAIGMLPGWVATFSHAVWFAGIDYEYAAVGMPLGRYGRAFLSVTALNSGEMDVRTVQSPLGTGERFSVTDVAIGAGYGFQVTDRVAAGLQVNYVQERIWHTSASTATLNLGTLYQISENGLRIGASVSNFGTRARFQGRDLRIIYDNDPNRTGDNNTLPGERFTSSYPLPQVFRVGLGAPFRLRADQRLFVAVDAFHPSDNTESMSVGAEYGYRQLLALRIGYQNLFLEDAEGGLSLGAGITAAFDPVRYHLDYGWTDFGRLNDTHRVSLGLSF